MKSEQEYTDNDLIKDLAMDFFDTHLEATMGKQAYKEYLSKEVSDEDCMKDYEAAEHIWLAVAKRAYWWFCKAE